jgi:hypothetical protein
MIRVAGRVRALPVWLLASCAIVAKGEAQAQDIEKAVWLTGCWLASSGSTETEEVWLAPKGGIMLGVSRTVRDGAATGYELLRLHEAEGRLVLSAYPSGQRPADFTLSGGSPGRLRFENPSHDFPRVIEYERVTADTLLARVYSEIEASTPAFVQRYARASCQGNQEVG